MTNKSISEKKQIMIVIISCLVIMAGLFAFLANKYYPNDKILKRQQGQLTKLMAEVKERKATLAKREQRRDSFIKNIKNYWFLEENQISKFVEHAATTSGVLLNQVNEVRTQLKSSDGTCVLELSISVNGNYLQCMDFLTQIRNLEPTFGWQNINIHIQERGHNNNNNINTNNIYIYGTIRVKAINNEFINEMLKEELGEEEFNVATKNNHKEQEEETVEAPNAEEAIPAAAPTIEKENNNEEKNKE